MDFGLKVERILSSAGDYVVDLSWMHVKNMAGYNIYRAESRSDDPNDWYKINGDKLVTVNYFQDRGFTGDPVSNAKAIWFYKILPVDLSGTEYALSDSQSESFNVTLEGIHRFVMPTIRSRVSIMLDPSRFSAAEPCHFLVRKWAGSYCECINVRTRKVDANCANCYGSGYSGGFALIENVYCHVRSATKQLLGDSGGITTQKTLTGIVGSYPRLTDGDILVREHNERYYCRRIKRRQTQNYTTAQSFELEHMQLYDTKRRIPCPKIVRPTAQHSQVSNVLS